MVTLLGIGYTTNSVGGYLSEQFPASLLDQVGHVITSIGDAAYSAFLIVLFTALGVIVLILYIREKVNPY